MDAETENYEARRSHQHETRGKAAYDASAVISIGDALERLRYALLEAKDYQRAQDGLDYLAECLALRMEHCPEV